MRSVPRARRTAEGHAGWTARAGWASSARLATAVAHVSVVAARFLPQAVAMGGVEPLVRVGSPEGARTGSSGPETGRLTALRQLRRWGPARPARTRTRGRHEAPAGADTAGGTAVTSKFHQPRTTSRRVAELTPWRVQPQQVRVAWISCVKSRGPAIGAIRTRPQRSSRKPRKRASKAVRGAHQARSRLLSMMSSPVAQRSARQGRRAGTARTPQRRHPLRTRPHDRERAIAHPRAAHAHCGVRVSLSCDAPH